MLEFNLDLATNFLPSGSRGKLFVQVENFCPTEKKAFYIHGIVAFVASICKFMINACYPALVGVLTPKINPYPAKKNSRFLAFSNIHIDDPWLHGGP